jgi:polar amino acid transport system substrate-binding protein
MAHLKLTRRAFHLGAASALAAGFLLPSLARADGSMPPPGSPTIRGILAARKLRVGMSAGFAPFVVAGDDVDGFLALMTDDRPTPRIAVHGRRVVGLDVDLSVALAEALGVSLEIVLVERFDQLFEGLGRSDFDGVLSGVTRTLARARSLSFSQPYLISGQELYTKDATRFPTLEAVSKAGVKVGAKQGTTGEAFAKEALGGASYVPHPNSDALFAALDSGAVDVAVADGLVGRDMILRKKVKAALSSVEQRRVTAESIAMVARQGDTDWTDYLSLLVRETRTSGRFHRLAHRYNPWLRAER